jgi:serine/threonine protein phosphatase PrpC
VVRNEEALAIEEDHYAINHTLKGAAALLCGRAIEKGSTDNITVLVVDLLQYAGIKK